MRWNGSPGRCAVRGQEKVNGRQRREGFVGPRSPPLHLPPPPPLFPYNEARHGSSVSASPQSIITGFVKAIFPAFNNRATKREENIHPKSITETSLIMGSLSTTLQRRGLAKLAVID
ncbi:hypothetical protein DPEC_G00287080 [Dallia pectoralis]|uniref:Uncharacterized protein n=1 Tax=Dallia pectoralis TaxID=75939 RepID=A0ACC2FK41_DALPE|nr:hypothetical protein DPEC_G00287080 [Dallia pectoralis]